MRIDLAKHKTEYGYDKLIIGISDKISNYFENEIKNLRFEHIWDDDKITLDQVKKYNFKGYSKHKENIIKGFSLFIKCDSLIKARENALNTLSAFKRIFEKLGIYLEEFSSYNDKSFYLLTYVEKVFIPVQITIEDNIVSINISSLLELFCNQLPHYFNPYEFAFIAQNLNRSEIHKKIIELQQMKGLYLSEIGDKENEQFDIILTVSISLMNDKKYRVDINGEIKEVNSDNLVDFLAFEKLKIAAKNYRNSMKNTSNYLNSNLVDNCYICESCLNEIQGRIILKSFVQDIDNVCSKCKVNKGTRYIIF